MHSNEDRGKKKNRVKTKEITVEKELTIGQVPMIVESNAAAMENVNAEIGGDELLRQAASIENRNGLKSKTRKRRISLSDPPLCSVCGRTFKHNSSLSRHFENFGDPTYPCEKCGTKFATERQLNFHIKQAHDITNCHMWKYQCPFCGQLVVTMNYLRSHVYHFHDGWESMYPNLFTDAEETLKNKANRVEKNTPTEDCETSVGENSKERTLTRKMNDSDSSSTTRPRIQDASTTDLKTKSCSTTSSENKTFTPMSPGTEGSPKSSAQTRRMSRMHFNNNDYSTASKVNNNPLTTLIENPEASSDRSSRVDDRTMRENEREVELRALYSCKDCYIPLPRIHARVPSAIKPNQSEHDEDATYLPCSLCHRRFSTEIGRRAHINLSHTINASVICSREYASKKALISHLNQCHFLHIEDKTYCVCGMELAAHSAMHRHFYKHAINVVRTKEPPATHCNACKPSPTKFRCKKCGAEFWLETCLEYHQSDNCGLETHLKSAHKMHSSLRRPYHCSVCNQGFNQQEFEHIHRMHFHPETTVGEGSGESEVDEVPMTDSDVSDDETPMKCNVCDLEFATGKRLINHLVYYTESEIIQCSVCREEFEGQCKAHRHNKLVHYSSNSQNALTHQCAICREGFMWKIQLQSHLSHVHGIAPIEAQYMAKNSNSERNGAQKNSHWNVVDTCKICDMIFPSPVLLAAHEDENMNDGEFVCNKCSRRCRTASILLDHLSLNHSSITIQDGVKCRRCNENFQTQSAWVSHVKHFHFTEEPSEFYFEKNAKSTEKAGGSLRFELIIPTNHSITSGGTSSRIKTSLDREHSVLQNFVKLEEPDVEFDSVADAKIDRCNNRESDELVTEKPRTCAICVTSFRSPAEFARHAALYSNTGHYICELCGRRFAWLSIYQEHKKKHYSNETDEFFCLTCGEGFETLQCKTSHETHLHGRSSEENEDKKIIHDQQSNSPKTFQSSLVPRLSSNESSIRANSTNTEQSISREQEDEEGDLPRLHAEIFEDELSTSYQCPDCQEQYSTLDQLYEHLALVHNMKQDPSEESSDAKNAFDSLICEICDTKFLNRNLLDAHQKTVHCLQLIELNSVVTVTVRKSYVTKLPTKRFLCFDNDHNNVVVKKKKLMAVPKLVKITSAPSTANTEKKDAVQVSSMTVIREHVSSTTNNVQTGDSNRYRRSICDIVFADTTALRTHEVRAHCLTISRNHSSEVSSQRATFDSSNSPLQQLSILVGNLPISSPILNDTAIVVDFEDIGIPETTCDFNIFVPERDESTESSKSAESTSGSGIDCLPSGNYTFSTLKLRPFAEIAEKTRQPRMTDTGGGTESPRKKPLILRSH